MSAGPAAGGAATGKRWRVGAAVLLAAALCGLAWWWLDAGRRLSETQVRGYYREQLEATVGYDADRICASMDADYAQEDTAHLPDGQTEIAKFDRRTGCKTVAATLDAFRHMADSTDGARRPDFKVRIERIAIATDRKAATVEAVTTVTVGDHLLARSRGSERLVRRMGRIRSLGGTSESWSY